MLRYGAPGRDLLTGRVEVDESYVGGEEVGLPGRLNLKKALVVVAAQGDRAGNRPDSDASSHRRLRRDLAFMRESVQPGSIVHTDGWLEYLPLERNGYQA